MVGAVDAGRVVDRVRVDPAAGHRVLDAAALGEAQVAALADHPRAQLSAVHAQRVVGAVADVGVRLGLGLDERADAAVPEQVDRRTQHRVAQLGRRHALGRDAQSFARLWRQRHRLGRPRPDASALGDQRAVVVVPRRAGQGEQPLPLGERRRRDRGRVDEHMAVVERRHHPGHGRQEHAVAEDVAGHVADSDNGERLRHHVATHLAEVALDALPRALGGDAERLVVVPGGPARGVGVAQPVPVLEADLVGGVREVGGALVGGHDEVRVGVRVEHPHLGRPHDLAGGDVVRQVEHAPHQRDVLPALLLHQLAAVGRRLLEHEPALRPGGHDHGVLDHLRLHQARGSRCGSPPAGRSSGCRRGRRSRRAGGRPPSPGCRRRSPTWAPAWGFPARPRSAA